ncbi:MAG: hypothetical protein JXK94_02300 [Deltaproteobacteria bacterium]|nr:hypothetical protein [Deltaproteobacteria bacterium]
MIIQPIQDKEYFIAILGRRKEGETVLEKLERKKRGFGSDSVKSLARATSTRQNLGFSQQDPQKRH